MRDYVAVKAGNMRIVGERIFPTHLSKRWDSMRFSFYEGGKYICVWIERDIGIFIALTEARRARQMLKATLVAVEK